MTADDGPDVSAFRLLTQLFLRRFVENDLISPHTDRHESLAVLLATVVSVSVFVTFFLSTSYLATFILLPGPAALSALLDRFLFIAASIVVCALGALAVWDALALEGRDATILGPLPIAMRTITWAKLAAAVVFGAALAVALNTVPSLLYPVFFTKNIRGVGGLTVLHLIAAHGATLTCAGLFGFFGVIAIRGMLRLVLSERVFPRVSAGVQSALVVSMITALLLTLGVRATDVREWVSHPDVAPWPVHPALWYLGLNEAEAGHRVAEAPIVLPPRMRSIPLRLVQQDQAARQIYHAMGQTFTALERRAWISLLAATVLALATFFLTNRRLPDRSAGVHRPSRLRTALRAVAERWTAGDPEAQAGSFFTLQTLVRSARHRTVLAVALAIGLTHAFVVLAHAGAGGTVSRLGVLGMSTLLMLSLAGGVVHAVNIPAEPNANWAIRMSWLGDERAYLGGVKRAALLVVCTPLILLLPLHVVLLGTTDAIVHTWFGLGLAMAALDALFLPCRKLPFACGYVPVENPKIVWPAAFVGLLLVTYVFALAERRALETAVSEIWFGLLLGAVVPGIKAVDSARRRERHAVDFDGRPTPTTQQLGLLAQIEGHQDF